MPLRYPGRNRWLRARLVSEIDGSGLSLDGVRERLENGDIEVALNQACGRGGFARLALPTLTGVFDPGPGGDVSFDPVLNTAPGLRLHPGVSGPSTRQRLPTKPRGPCRRRSSAGAPEQVTQGPVQVGLAEPVPGSAEPVGHHALAGAGQFAGALRAE